jgi:propanol-preferring alcohol dehydrogenase
MQVPDALTSEQAAPFFCAGLTVYRAIKNAEIKPGQRVAVFGIGGLGHLAVQIAKAFGAEVIAVDLTDDKLELARSLGADHTVNARTSDAVKELRRMGSAHVAIVTSGAKAAYDTAFYALRGNGTLVVVGMPADDLTFPAIQMREIKIMSSATGTREDLREILQMAAEGKVKCLVETQPLEVINEVFEQMRRGQITGRVVLKL